MAFSRGARLAAPLFALVLVGLVLAVAPSAGGERTPTARVALSFSGRELRVDASLVDGLPRSVADRLGSGLATATAWQVRLYVSRALWFDGLKDERRYEVAATFRPVSSDYAVEQRLDGRLLETRVVSERDEAARALARVPSLPSFMMGEHLEKKSLVVRVRCAYASGVSLGVVPTTETTPWAASAVFVWNGTSAALR